MFNYAADQIFVIQPRGCGGGILSLLLSLDSRTASLNFQNKTVVSKIDDWQKFCQRTTKDAHIYGFVNFAASEHTKNIASADNSHRYIHKLHYYELDAINADKRNPLLSQMHGNKSSVGIYLTDQCESTLLRLRPTLPSIDYYQKWIYANQAKLLPEFFDISSVHVLSFSEMLNLDAFLDHLAYCREVLDLDIDLAQCKIIIKQWYEIIKNVS